MHRPYIAVAGVIKNNQQEVFLIREGGGETKEPARGWMLPIGKLERNESLKEACVREIKEETGMEVQIGDLLTVVEGNVDDEVAIIVLVFKIYKILNSGGKKADEIEDFGWINLDKVKELKNDNDIRDGFPLLEVLTSGKKLISFEVKGRIRKRFKELMRDVDK